jgi:hypothetical protein
MCTSTRPLNQPLSSASEAHSCSHAYSYAGPHSIYSVYACMGWPGSMLCHDQLCLTWCCCCCIHGSVQGVIHWVGLLLDLLLDAGLTLDPGWGQVRCCSTF